MNRNDYIFVLVDVRRYGMHIVEHGIVPDCINPETIVKTYDLNGPSSEGLFNAASALLDQIQGQYPDDINWPYSLF